MNTCTNAQLELKQVLDRHAPLDVSEESTETRCRSERLTIVLELAIDLAIESGVDMWQLLRLLATAFGRRAGARGHPL